MKQPCHPDPSSDDLSTDEIRARLRQSTFNLDRSAKEYALGHRKTPPREQSLRVTRNALDALAASGVVQGDDLDYAREVLKRHERLLEEGIYDMAAPTPVAPAEGDATEKRLKSRRSVRFWTDAEVPDALIRRVIDAALWAPSSCNRQPLRFIVCRRGDRTHKAVLKACPHRQISRAPVTILLLVDLRILPEGARQDRGTRDIGAAAQNTLLMASALGLGACWMGQKRLRDLQLHQALNLPDYLAIDSAIVLGRPVEQPLPPGRIGVDDAIIPAREPKMSAE